MTGAETKARSWVVAGGGTGGHVTPAIALAERIRSRGDSVALLGSEYGLETRLVPAAGFPLVVLPAKQLMGQSFAKRIAALPGMLRACATALRVLRKRRADIVVSVGGYASVPAVVAAVLQRVPLVLVEPNAIPGRANRLAARFARRIFVQFEESTRRFEAFGGRGRVHNTGIPLREDLLRAFDVDCPRRIPTEPLRLLIFGGSQGAQQINEAMIEAAPRLDPAAIEIVHQTGEADRDRVAAAYADAKLEADVVSFENDMPSRYRWADLALCRSGALTVAELALAALPSLLVPYPFAADDHQAANARALKTAGAAHLFEGAANLGERLATSLRALCRLSESTNELRSMSACAANLARPEASRHIVDECAELMRPAGRRGHRGPREN